MLRGTCTSPQGRTTYPRVAVVGHHEGYSSESAEQHSQHSLIAIISFPLGNNAFTDFNSLVGYVEETVQDALKEKSSRTIYKMTSLHTSSCPTALRT